MADTLSPQARSRVMSRIKGKDTGPELALRRALHAQGYRYRLHVRALPGTPDLVFPARRKVIFVHGCFWHQHPGCKRATIPSSRREFWLPKLARTVERDRAAIAALNAAGWDVLVIWECALKAPASAIEACRAFLADGGDGSAGQIPASPPCPRPVPPL